MINTYKIIALINMCNISFCDDLKFFELKSNEEIRIQESHFCIKSIGSLDNSSSDYGWENYLLFSNKRNGFQIIIDDNIRAFSMYVSLSCKNCVAISSNYASRENRITIYSLMSKEPYIRMIYQTPENKKSRTVWSIKTWNGDNIIMNKSTEGKEEVDEKILLKYDN